jgi:NitT/TauT family transport system permease protein
VRQVRPLQTSGSDDVPFEIEQVTGLPGLALPAESPPHLDDDRRLAGLKLWLLRLLVLLVVLGFWQLSAGHLVPIYETSSPAKVAQRLGTWATSRTLWVDLWSTVHEMLLGLVLGVAAGAGTGIAMGMLHRTAKVFDPFLVALNALPKIAIAPLFILWFGIGLEMKVVFVATIVYFLVLWNVIGGVRSADAELIDVLRMMGATRRQMLRVVFLPTAAEWIFAGLKIALPFALVGAVVAEMLSANSGMGYLILNAASTFDPASLMAGLIVLMVLSMLLNAVLTLIERRVLSWKG